jgi:hypothetical protein
MDSLLNRNATRWAMIANVALIYGVLALTGAALVKYLFTQRSSTAA